jgi:ornithine cyclodeaminase/alanine dehydrogenase-like protein (mu-crystallin family)
VKVLSADQTRQALPMPAMIEALRVLFATGCEVPLRHTHVLPGPVTSLIMPAWISGKYYGVKIINIAPNNTALGKPGLFAVYTLFDAATGEPLAQLEGNALTAARTAAASALAASYLARPEAKHLTLVGSGRIAALLAPAYAAVRTLESVTIWSPQQAHANRLLLQLREDARLEGVKLSVCESLENAVRAADMVSCATLASAPLVRGQWLAPGSHLDLIGGFAPNMREADDACFAGASLFVDTDEAAQKSGDLLGPLARGVFSLHDIRANLGQLCQSKHPGRTHALERTVFKSVGSALEDLAAAMLAFETYSKE